jgi:eukaryotic-like serine/threonine-protein kinase
MALTAGMKLGPYEIQSYLGAGGMGEVYHARDTRLERSVAIKILRAHVSEDSEAKQRFDREARAISSLSHPNICSLYDIGAQDNVSYIVMEYLRGETLADRLEKGPLQLPQLLKCAVDICDGLATAHRSGVIHRDLKPGNIMLTKSGAKLMDFGLAKSMAVVTPGSQGATTIASTPISGAPLTAQGTVVGTFRYMSPEQIEGHEADVRSDIFSLGCVLYEMATGKPAFEGKSPASIMAAIIERDPAPITAFGPQLPPALDRVVKSCLAKDPDDRFQTVHDIKLQLKWIAEAESSSSAPARRRVTARERIVWIATTLCLLLLAVFAVFHFSGRKQQLVLQTSITAPDTLRFNFSGNIAGPPAISPNGTQIVFSGISEGKTELYLRSLSDLSIRPLVGTDDGRFPFWSPDSRAIAFFADGKLKRLDFSGGVPVTICDAVNGRGGSWGSAGTIIFAPSYNSTLMQVAAGGGFPTEIFKLDVSKYSTYRWPWFLPDGKHFLYFATNHLTPNNPNTGGVFFASTDGKENRLLFHSATNAIYASGYLLYVVGTTLRAQAFDPGSGKIQGDSSLLADGVQNDAEVWRGIVAASGNGLLLYQPASSVATLKLAWFDRNGKQLEEIAEPDQYYQVRLSPDDKKLALVIGQPSPTIWIYDLARDSKSRFTFDDKAHSNPVWSPDGNQLAYSLSDGGVLDAAIFSKASNGAGVPKQLLARTPEDAALVAPTDWSPDGRWMIYARGTMGGGAQGADLWAFPLDGSQKPFPYISGPGDQIDAQFSPDGHFVAYQSNENGNPEIYVAAFPWTGAKWQVSTDGGNSPRWRRDGRELFFVYGEQFMSAGVNKAGSGLEISQPRPLFRLNVAVGEQASRYAVTGDGNRFAVLVQRQNSSPLVLVQNWTTQLKGR